MVPPAVAQEEERSFEDAFEAVASAVDNGIQEVLEFAEIAVSGETNLSKSTMSVAKLLKMPITLLADALSQILSFFASITDFLAKVIGKSPRSAV